MSFGRQRYFRGDLRRAFCTVRFPVGIAGVVFAMFYSLHQMADITSVYTAYMNALYFLPFAVALLFCALPFAGSLAEDVKHRYIQLLVMRGSLWRYTLSKIVWIYVSAIAGMVLGVLLFVLLARMQAPWELADELLYGDILTEVFWKKGYHLLFFMAHSFFMGLLAGNLSLLAALVSLFWQEELMTIAVPFLAYYLLVYYGYGLYGDAQCLDVQQAFNVSYNVWNHPVYSLLWPLVVSQFLAVCMGAVIYIRLRGLYEK